jgi:DNA-binding MarR family transcriptional regulator
MSEVLIATAISRLVAAAARRRAAAAAYAHVTVTDVAAVEELAARGELTPGELARCMTLSSSGTSVLVHRLESACLIVRQAHGGRRVTLVLTADGEALAQLSALPSLTGLLAAVPVEDRQAAERLIRELADGAERDAERLATEAEAAARAAAGLPDPPLWG